MITSKKIGHTHLEEMNSILLFTLSFDVDRLLYSINGRKLDENDIESITLDIQEQNNKLSRQRNHLFKFGTVFNKKYTNEDNKFFETSVRVSRKIRSGTKGVRDILKKFCRISRKPSVPGQEAPQAINVSLISTPNYVADIFGLSSYPDCVRTLFQTMLDFYSNLDDCIHEAIRILQEEKDTRNDKRKTLKLLQEALEKSKNNQAHIIQAIFDEPEFKNAILKSVSLNSNEANPVLKQWKNCSNEEEFAAEYFHNCTPSDISKIALYNVINQSADNLEVNRCMVLMGCDEQKANQIIEAINHFDDLLPEKCKRNQIPAMYLYVFKNWCSSGIGYSMFLSFFNRQYEAASGRWNLITEHALRGVSSQSIKKRNQFEEVKRTMEEKLKQMFQEK